MLKLSFVVSVILFHLPALANLPRARPLERHCTSYSGPTYSDTRLCYVIRDGYAVVGGDMIIGEAAQIQDKHFVGFRTAPERGLWPQGRVPYEFANDVPQTVRALVQQAIATYTQRTAARFVPRANNENAYVQVVLHHDAGYAAADLGYTGGMTRMFIGRSASSRQTLHEMGHVLGLGHEHQRPDRNQHVRVNMANVQQPLQEWYRVIPGGSTINEYDVNSIMHYSSAEGSNGSGNTVERLSGQAIPMPTTLSNGDIAAIQELVRQAGR